MATTWVDDDFRGSGAVNGSTAATKYTTVGAWSGYGTKDRSATGATLPGSESHWSVTAADASPAVAPGAVLVIETAAYYCCAVVVMFDDSELLQLEFEHSTGDLILFDQYMTELGRYAAGSPRGRAQLSVLRVELEGTTARGYLDGTLRITATGAIPSGSRSIAVVGAGRSTIDYPATTSAGDVIDYVAAVADTTSGPLRGSGADVEGVVAVDGMLGQPQAVGSVAIGARASVDGVLGAPRALVLAVYGRASVASILGQPRTLVLLDFTASLDTLAPTYWVADLITPGGLVRVPITSWQATLRLGEPGTAQCVVTAAGDYIDDILAATEFVVSRRAALLVGGVMEAPMIRAPISQVSTARGPINFTVTILGDLPASALPAGATVPERALADVRTVSTYDGYTRVRAAVDWLLRPGHIALLDEEEISVETISYYVAFDAYMDLADR